MKKAQQQYLLLIIVVCFSSCSGPLQNSEGKRFYLEHHTKEGDNLQLKYIVPVTDEDCMFNLTYDNTIFNLNGLFHISNKYPHEKLERSSVQREQLFGYTVISLTIEDIEFSDRGEYSCVFLCANVTYSQAYNITVSKPPGSANCYWQDDPYGPQDFSFLICSARNGYPDVGIICYESSLAHLPVSTSTDNNVITSKFSLNRRSDVSCCSVNLEFTKSSKTCDDFYSSVSPSTFPTEDKANEVGKSYVTEQYSSHGVATTQSTAIISKDNKKISDNFKIVFTLSIIIPLAFVIFIILLKNRFVRPLQERSLNWTDLQERSLNWTDLQERSLNSTDSVEFEEPEPEVQYSTPRKGAYSSVKSSKCESFTEMK